MFICYCLDKCNSEQTQKKKSGTARDQASKEDYALSHT